MTLTDGKVFIGVQREVQMENSAYSTRKAKSGKNLRFKCKCGSILYKYSGTLLGKVFLEWNRDLIWKEGEDERVNVL